MMARTVEDDQMVDMVLMAGRGAGPRYVNLEDQTDVWTFLEPAPSPAPPGIPYQRLGALGDVTTPAPFIYSVELEIAPEHLPEIFKWYEGEHFPMLTSVAGCLGGIRYQRLDGGTPNLLAAYRFATPEVNLSEGWLAARGTEWTVRMRPYFRGQRRFTRRLEA